MRCFRVTAALLLLLALFISGCASREHFLEVHTDVIPVDNLYRPDIAGRLPAVIFLAPCNGVTQHLREWATWLKARGYVVAIVDSFSPRGSINACRGESPLIPEVARDALATLRYLATLPFVAVDRVAVMGWSHGGGAALAISLLEHLNDDNDSPTQSSFRAVVAFYPPCEFLDPNTHIPTLMLLAGRDDWSPPGQCIDAGGKNLVTSKLYPDAYHAFDQPGSMRTYLGHMMAYDASATNASRHEVETFLAEQLKREVLAPSN
jgi:dienelactone hydrolase